MASKNVCADCFSDEFLQRLIRKNATASRCDYCGTTAEELTGDKDALIAAPFESVMGPIEDGLSWGWNSADDEGIPYESAEGGYQAQIYDTYDLVQDFVSPNDDALLDEIVNALPDQPWVERTRASSHECFGR